MEDLSQCIGFEWDSGNSRKNWLKHHVSPMECEELFFNRPLVIAEDTKHSHQEKRYYALGQTNMKRFLYVVFVVRNRNIRVVSARDMNRKEREVYLGDEEKTNS